MWVVIFLSTNKGYFSKLLYTFNSWTPVHDIDKPIADDRYMFDDIFPLQEQEDPLIP